MSICNSCGGVIGRDCFNPSECAWIEQQQNARAEEDARITAHENEHLHADLSAANARIADLEKERDEAKEEVRAGSVVIEELIQERDEALDGLTKAGEEIAGLKRADEVNRVNCKVGAIELAKVRAERDSLRAQLDRAEARVKELEGQRLPSGTVITTPIKRRTTKPTEPTFLPVHGPATGGANTERKQP